MPIPSVEFLFDASKRSLEDAELAEMNRSANLEKTIRVERAEQIESLARALMYRWMMDNRDALISRREVVVPASPKKATKLFENPKEKSG